MSVPPDASVIASAHFESVEELLHATSAWAPLAPLELPLRDLAEGIRLGHFRVPSHEAAFDLLFGGIREALRRLGQGKAPPSFAEQMTEICLQALGTDPRRIEATLAHRRPELLGRARARAVGGGKAST